jgi:tetratricopeptide (TPR) repeat protein
MGMSFSFFSRDALVAAGILILCGGAAAAAGSGEDGVAAYLRGDLETAIASFSHASQQDPRDAMAKNLLGNCLVIAAKDALSRKDYRKGFAYLEEANRVLADRKELRTLALLAEMEDKFAAGKEVIRPADIDAQKEKYDVFNLIFLGSLPAAPGTKDRFVIHYAVPGETLATLANQYYHDYNAWRKIWQSNPQLSNPHRLFPGTRLVIPLP